MPRIGPNACELALKFTDLDMAELAELAEFGRDLLAAKDTGDFSPIMDDPDRLDDLDRIVRRSQRRLRFLEPFDRRTANERLALAGADEEMSP